jgi:hypothetical protein
MKIVPATALEAVLGRFLFNGMQLSRTRRQEDSVFTRAVYLHLPIAQGDFTLEVFQHPTYGDCVLETGKLSIEPLRCLLGDFLFEAMMNSTYRRDEEARGKLVTSAVVILKDDNGDKRLRVKANFDAGAQIWNVMSLHSMGVLAPPS